ncbi:unnamed protein product [Tenebrio molitor]|nr:unnamed protein product [Tenebrio molitor]
MDDGCVAEFDTPYQLLQNSDGLFYAFVKENGEEFLHNYIKAAENKQKKVELISTLPIDTQVPATT